MKYVQGIVIFLICFPKILKHSHKLEINTSIIINPNLEVTITGILQMGTIEEKA